MPENRRFPPEGLRPPVSPTLEEVRAAAQSGEILEGLVERCDAEQTLHVRLGGLTGRIPREEAVAPWISGAERDISRLSRVGKPTCFTVISVRPDAKGAPDILLSRRAAQQTAMDWMTRHLLPGAVLLCRVVRLEPFGAFVDIGCGIIAILPVERLSISRISHPKERLQEGQKILAAVLAIDQTRRRVTMTHRELLGTWMENASHFSPGETVRGVIRTIKPYGCFVELAPNLSGLADTRTDLEEGNAVSVYIRSIRPERMKIKLQVIERLPSAPEPEPLCYFITDGTLERWRYSPPGCEKTPVETIFSPALADGSGVPDRCQAD